MTTHLVDRPPGRAWWPACHRRHIPVLATLALLLVMYGIGVSQYQAFSNVQVIFNVFIDNGFLLVVAVGHDLRDPHRRHRPVGRLGGRR